jgi:hypothetical protein
MSVLFSHVEHQDRNASLRASTTTGHYFFDRNQDAFAAILDWYCCVWWFGFSCGRCEVAVVAVQLCCCIEQ